MASNGCQVEVHKLYFQNKKTGIPRTSGAPSICNAFTIARFLVLFYFIYFRRPHMSAINAAIFYFSILFYFTCADDLTRSGVLQLASGEWAKYCTLYVYM